MGSFSRAAIAAAALGGAASAASNASASSLPVVDLGYEMHQAAVFNVSVLDTRQNESATNVMSANWWLLQLFQHPIRCPPCR